MREPASPETAGPSPHSWRTTDENEINRRRARTEQFRVSNTDSRQSSLHALAQFAEEAQAAVFRA